MVTKMSEALLKEIYVEILYIKKKSDFLEEIIIPRKHISQEGLEEIETLKKESLLGESVRWEEINQELL